MSSEIDATYDLIVVGLGAMGAAVTYQAAHAGLDVLGIDRFDPPHHLGSSHADTRISRLAVGEGEQYLPFVARSHELWSSISDAVGYPVFHESGGFIVTDHGGRGDRWNDFVTETSRIADRAGVDFVVEQPSDVRARFPHIKLPDSVRVGFEPTAGLVMCERAIKAQLDLAARSRATLRRNEAVARIDPHPNEVIVETNQGTYRGGHVVLATGPWLADLASPEHRNQLTVTRQVVLWFEADDLGRFGVEQHPFVMWVGETDEDYMAVFGRPEGTVEAVKVLSEQFLETTTADTVDRVISDDEVATFHARHVAPKFDGISTRCIKREVCLYTNTPDDHFLIEADPRSDRITVMSPCSGHGFKHSAALGEAVVQQVMTGTSQLDLGPFASRR